MGYFDIVFSSLVSRVTSEYRINSTENISNLDINNYFLNEGYYYMSEKLVCRFIFKQCDFNFHYSVFMLFASCFLQERVDQQKFVRELKIENKLAI